MNGRFGDSISESCPTAITHSGLRCGKEYFALAPADRKPQALSRYPETLPTDTCDSWRASEPTKLVAAQK